MDTLRLQFLATPSWQCGPRQGPLTGKFAPLVALVAVNGRQPRDTLAQLLWPGDMARANDNLRQHVRRLRAATGHALFVHGETLQLAAGVVCDVHERSADWPLPQLLAGGDFLAGVDYPHLRLLSRWLQVQRDHWRSSFGDALTQRATALQAAGRAAEALQAVDRATALAPCLESAWRLRMQLRHQHGDRVAALAAFAGLESHLREHRGALPSEETQTLRRLIERSGTLDDPSHASSLSPVPPGSNPAHERAAQALRRGLEAVAAALAELQALGSLRDSTPQLPWRPEPPQGANRSLAASRAETTPLKLGHVAPCLAPRLAPCLSASDVKASA